VILQFQLEYALALWETPHLYIRFFLFTRSSSRQSIRDILNDPTVGFTDMKKERKKERHRRTEGKAVG